MKNIYLGLALLVLCSASGGYDDYKKPCRVAWCADCSLDPQICIDCVKGFWLTLNGLCSQHYEDSIEYRTMVTDKYEEELSSGYYYDDSKKPCRVAWCADCSLDPQICVDCVKGFWLTLNGLCSEHYEDSIEYRTMVADKYEEPKYEEPKYEEPKYEEPKYEEPKYEEPKEEDKGFGYGDYDMGGYTGGQSGGSSWTGGQSGGSSWTGGQSGGSSWTGGQSGGSSWTGGQSGSQGSGSSWTGGQSGSQGSGSSWTGGQSGSQTGGGSSWNGGSWP